MWSYTVMGVCCIHTVQNALGVLLFLAFPVTFARVSA